MWCSKFPATENLRKPLFCSLQSKMLLYFGLLFTALLMLSSILRIYGVPFTSFTGEYTQRQQEFFHELGLIADLKQNYFMNWLDGRVNDVQTHATNPLLHAQLQLISEKRQSLQATASDEISWEKIRKEPEYQNLYNYFQVIKQNHPEYRTLYFV